MTNVSNPGPWTGWIPQKVNAYYSTLWGEGWHLQAPTAIDGVPISWKFSDDVAVKYE